MSSNEILAFIGLAAFASYVQTLTGFAFGLMMMGGIAMSGLLPIPDAAAIVGVLTLTNGAQMLLKGWREVAWRPFGLMMAGSLPMLLAGFWLLEHLAGERLDLLRLLLGLLIILSCLQLMRRPEPLARLSPPLSFVAFGAIGGIMGGLFSTAGPPLIYHLHRQPIPRARVRETLVTIFASNQVVRLGIVFASGTFPSGGALWGLLALPAVIVATHAARRWPPPITPTAMRFIVLTLLFLSGLMLAAPAMRDLFARLGL